MSTESKSVLNTAADDGRRRNDSWMAILVNLVSYPNVGVALMTGVGFRYHVFCLSSNACVGDWSEHVTEKHHEQDRIHSFQPNRCFWIFHSKTSKTAKTSKRIRVVSSITFPKSALPAPIQQAKYRMYTRVSTSLRPPSILTHPQYDASW